MVRPSGLKLGPVEETAATVRGLGGLAPSAAAIQIAVNRRFWAWSTQVMVITDRSSGEKAGSPTDLRRW